MRAGSCGSCLLRYPGFAVCCLARRRLLRCYVTPVVTSQHSHVSRTRYPLPATHYSPLATRYSLLAPRSTHLHLQVACSLFWAASHLWLNAVPRHSPPSIHPDHMDIVPPSNRYGVSWPISYLTSPMMWGWRFERVLAGQVVTSFGARTRVATSYLLKSRVVRP